MTLGLFNPEGAADLAALVDRVRAGGTDGNRALGVLLGALHTKLGPFLGSLGRHSDEAWAVAQTAAWQACARPVPDGTGHAGWIYMAAKNEARDHVRKQKRYETRHQAAVDGAEPWDEGHALDPEAALLADEAEGRTRREHKDEYAALFEARACDLTEAEDHLVHLLYYAGLSRAEVADALGVSRFAVARRERAVLRKLRGLVG
jgi:RNA polymerase sigma factor (sigma-70 family)